jgi:hypothetical protein
MSRGACAANQRFDHKLVDPGLQLDGELYFHAPHVTRKPALGQRPVLNGGLLPGRQYVDDSSAHFPPWSAISAVRRLTCDLPPVAAYPRIRGKNR